MKLIASNLYIFLFLLIISTRAYNQEIRKEFPYQLNKNTELIIIASGTILNLNYQYLKVQDDIDYLSETELNNLNSNSINSFDRRATYNWSPKKSETSTLIKNSLKYTPILFAIPYIKNKSWNNIFTLGLIYAEGYFVTIGVSRSTKIIVQRKRPYLYNSSTIPEDEKILLSQDYNSYLSFFSGHTAISFYTATYISKTYYDIYGLNEWFYIFTALSYTAATTVGYLRIQSGKHFPSDVITGAIVGGIFGYFIPEIHKKKNSNLTIYLPSNNQVGLIYRF